MRNLTKEEEQAVLQSIKVSPFVLSITPSFNHSLSFSKRNSSIFLNTYKVLNSQFKRGKYLRV